MDRRGPRVVIEMGVGCMAAGLLLAPLVRQPWHLYATLGVLVGGGSQLPGLYRPVALPAQLVRAPARSGHERRLLRRRRGLDHPAALAAGHDRARRLARRLLDAGPPGAGAAGAAQPAAASGDPRISGSSPTATAPRAPARPATRQPMSWIAAWVAVDWTLGRAMRTARFWWIAVGYFCGLFAWYAVQVHQTKYLVEIGFSADARGLGAGLREPGRHPRPDRARPCLRPHRARMGVDGRQPGLRALLPGPARPPPGTDAAAART